MKTMRNGLKRLVVFGLLIATALVPGRSWANCFDGQVPSAGCQGPPTQSFSLPALPTYPPNLPAGQPGTETVCGTCEGTETSCSSDQDCPGPQGALGVCIWGEYVDIRCFPLAPGALDDTCRLKKAAEIAAGKVLWIPADVTLSISPDEEDARCPSNPPETISAQGGAILHGIPILSDTIVTGGGTVKLRVTDPHPTNVKCDPCAEPNSSYEVCQNGHLFKLRDAHNVRISNITFDNNSLGLACQNEYNLAPGEQWPPHTSTHCANKGFYPGACEHRHAISIGGTSSNVTIDHCNLLNLVGDGVSIGDVGDNSAAPRPTPDGLVVWHNTFSAQPSRRNRNGVSVGAAKNLLIQDNDFFEMGRGWFRNPCEGGIPLTTPDSTCSLTPEQQANCSASSNQYACPVPMPGAIDLEPGYSSQIIERVGIIDNDIVGWAGPGNNASSCLNETAAGMSNAAGATIRDIIVKDNDISGCAQYAIGVNGAPHCSSVYSGPSCYDPIIVQNNDIHTTRPHFGIPNRWGIAVTRNITSGSPAVAHISGNKIRVGGMRGEIPATGTDMVGIFVNASKVDVVGNSVKGVRREGIFFDQRDGLSPPFEASNTFCGNLVCGNAADSGHNAMFIWGGDNTVHGNRIENSPRGIFVQHGSENEFTENILNSIGTCGQYDGCITCSESEVSCYPVGSCEGDPAGCQIFSGNTIPTSCSGPYPQCKQTNCTFCP